MSFVNRLRLKIFLILLLLTTACTSAAGSSQATPTPIPTPIVPAKPTYSVQVGDVQKVMEFSARLVPVEQVELFFRTEGYVSGVYIERGDAVEAGDLIAELVVDDLKNQLLLAQSGLELARSNNARSITEAEIALRAAELNLAISEANDPAPQIAIAQADLERAERELQSIQDTVTVFGGPDNIGESLSNRLRDAELEVEIAQALYDQALKSQEAYESQVEIQELEIELARMRLDQLKKGLDLRELELNVERLQTLLDNSQLRSPLDGHVIKINLSEGRDVQAYVPLAVVADKSLMELGADLTDRQLRELEEGMTVVCRPGSQPGVELQGAIRQLPFPYGSGQKDLEAQDPTPVRIALEGIEGQGYELGDLFYVTVLIEHKEDVLWLPPEAIRTFEGRKFVVVQDEEGQRRVDIKLGIESEDRVEILEGLSAGQIVLGR